MVTIASVLRLTLASLLFIVAWLPKPSVISPDKPLIVGENVVNLRVEYGVLWKYAHHNLAVVAVGDRSTPIVDKSLGVGVMTFEPSGLLKSILLTVVGVLLIVGGKRPGHLKKPVA